MMKIGRKVLGNWMLVGALLCSVPLAMGSPTQNTSHRRAAAKKAPPPPLPSGPTGPVQQIPLDSIAAVPPQVTYQNSELTIVAPNSTLADILRAVKKATGAEIDVPAAPERVVTRLGPGPARDVVADLLNGSRFNYVLLGAPDNLSALSRIVLVAKTGMQEVTPNPPAVAQSQPPQQPPQQQVFGQPEAANDNSEMPEQPPEDNAAPFGDDNNNQEQPPNEAEQQPQDNNPGVKTPQQMLQEMQQRQMQLQQQQPPGQAPIPGSGMPPHPPQEQ